MDEDCRREFGSAIRAAEGTPDADGTIPMRRDPKTGRWGVGRPTSRFGNDAILAAAFIGVAALIWLGS